MVLSFLVDQDKDSSKVDFSQVEDILGTEVGASAEHICKADADLENNSWNFTH